MGQTIELLKAHLLKEEEIEDVDHIHLYLKDYYSTEEGKQEGDKEDQHRRRRLLYEGLFIFFLHLFSLSPSHNLSIELMDPMSLSDYMDIMKEVNSSSSRCIYIVVEEDEES